MIFDDKASPLLFISLLLFALSNLQAEPQCPGNAASVRPQIVAGALLVIPVKVNHAGPYDFMFDTGSQLTIIDPSIAAQLDLKSRDKVVLVAASNVFQASVVVLGSLETGSMGVAKPLAAVQDLGPIQAARSGREFSRACSHYC